MIETLQREWRAVFLQSIATAIAIVLLIWGLSVLLGSGERNARIDDATTQIVQEVRSVRTLLCEALSEAENPNLVAAVKENCG